MKKGIILGAVLLLLGSGTQAQTFSEWFRQKKTQLKYLRQQIAALEAYTRVTEEGYRIVEEGTRLITDYKQGDLDLHSKHFTSFFKVNPAIERSGRADAIRKLATAIDATTKEIRQMALSLPAWSTVISECADGFWKESMEHTAALDMLTEDGTLGMQDEERMAAIDRVFERLKHCYEEAIRARNTIAVMLINKPI